METIYLTLPNDPVIVAEVRYLMTNIGGDYDLDNDVEWSE